MAVKLEKNHTTTLSAKGCVYSEGCFFSDGEVIDFEEWLGNFDGAFDITIKESSKETVTNE